MKVTNYILEIYEPGNGEAAWHRLESTTPFLSMSAGDLFVFLDEQGRPYNAQAVDVRHVFYNDEGEITHKIYVYTEVAPDAPELPPIP